MPHRRPAPFALALLLAAPCALASSAAAQSATIAADARVRITTDSAPAAPVIGALLAATPDSIRVRLLPSSAPISLANDRVRTLAVSEGRHGNALRGLVIGTVTGVVLGAASGYSSGDDPTSSFLAMTRGEKARFGAVFVGLLGAGTGALIGHFVKTETWRAVSLPVTVSLAPAGGGAITASVSLR